MSTRSALTIVGGIVGAYFGYPQLGLTIGALVGSAVDPQQIQGPKIGEIANQTSAEGVPRTIVYGTVSCYGNVIQTGQVVKVESTESQGKGGPEVTSERALRTYAIRICEGPIGGVLRVWEDNKLVYDVRTGSQMLAESQRWATNKVIYLGDESQVPDPNLVELNSDAPAYRGSAYAVFILEDLTARQGSIPQYRFEVASSAAFSPSDPIIAPLIGKLIWQGQTFSGTFTEYGETAEEAVFASGRAQEGSGPLFYEFETCFNYGGGDPAFWRCSYFQENGSPYFSNMNAEEIPGKGLPDLTFVRVEGPARVLADVIYAGEVLVQQSLAPILLPGDPNYDNDAFWEAAREAALLAGTLQPGVDTPVDVFEYAQKDVADTGQGNPVELGDIVSDIHLRCGFVAGDYDVTELNDMVAGLGLAGDYTGASAIDSLRTVYFFDKSEHDKKLWYPKRGAAVIETLTLDDLTEVPDKTTREQAIEVPKKLHLRYQHAASGYAPVKATATSSSPDLMTKGEVAVEVPVVLNEDQAAQTADKMYKVTRAELAGETTITVPLDVGAVYVAGNCLGLSLRGATRRVRIHQIDFADWKLALTLKPDRQSAYTSNLTGVPIPEPTLPPSTIVGDTELAVLDIPARVDSEDDLNYLVAVSGQLPPWYGATYQRSLDGGGNFSSVTDIMQPSIMGELLNNVPSAMEGITDTTNELRIRLYRENQTLDSLNEIAFLSEQGAFALEKADGSWEVMQYMDSVVDSNGDFLLSTLHRGLLNSGPSAHIIGARFVMLNRPTHIPAQSSWLNLLITHRAVSFGESADETTNAVAQTYVGRSQLEWPVASLALERDGSDNISGTWAPRHRFGSDDAPVASVNFIGYRVTIDDGSSSVTFDITTPSFTYDASAMADPVTVSVSAVNRITGAGPATSESV